MAGDDHGPIPLARPAIGDEEIAAVIRTIQSGRLVLGPENQRFEERLAELTGRAHAVCVSSGTTALELALWALERDDPRGQAAAGRDLGEVVVPAGGYPAAANAALRLGYRPVAVDLHPETWTLDVSAVGDAIGDATRAVIQVDTFGLVPEIAPLDELCGRAGVALVDDAACSLGAVDPHGVPGGGYGVAATLSFHPRKVITTGEGGAVVCDDEDLAARLRELRNQGQAVPGPGSAPGSTPGSTPSTIDRRRFVRVGTNARLNEMAAAMGRVQLDRLDAALRERELLAAGYRERLAALESAGKLSWQTPPSGARPAWQTFAVLLGPGTDRDPVHAGLAERDIEAGVAAFSLGRLASYRDLPGIRGRRTPVADALHDRGLALPLYSGMRAAELDRVAEALAEVMP